MKKDLQMSKSLSEFLQQAPKGTVLFKEGDPGKEMYFIHSGKVRIEKKIGNKVECIAVMEKGDFFGEMSLLEQRRRMGAAIVEEDANLLKVDAENFVKLLESNIEIAIRMIRKYAARLRQTNNKLAALVSNQNQMDQGIQEILDSVKTRSMDPHIETEKPHQFAEFVSPQGYGRFPVSKESVLIGRFDPVTNVEPDIDLTIADGTKSTSRQHARLKIQNGKFILTEEVGVTNGTYVNKERLTPGKSIELQSGDKVIFGHVPFTFQIKD